MIRLTVMLAATTLISGSAMLYYARALQVERSQHALQAASAPPEVARSSAAPEPAFRGTWLESRDRPSPSTAAAGEPAAVGRTADSARLAVARYRLEQLRDPAVRASEITKHLAMQRSSLQRMARHAGLRPDEVETLAQAAGRLNVEMELHMLECEADAACDLRNFREPDWAEKRMQEELTGLIGAEKFERLRLHEEASRERMLAQQLRDTLPTEHAFDEDTAEKLSLALAQERQRFDRDAERRNEKVEAFMSGTHPGFELHTTATPGAANESRQRVESARTYVDRFEERASGLLDERQMISFKAATRKTLAAYERELAEKDIAAAARRAAGQH